MYKPSRPDPLLQFAVFVLVTAVLISTVLMFAGYANSRVENSSPLEQMIDYRFE